MATFAATVFLFAWAALSAAALAAAQPVEEELPPADPVDVLKHEVKMLRGQKTALQDDKQALLKTVQQVLRTNQTQAAVLERQVTDMARAKASAEERCARERASLESETKKAEESTAAAQEVIQALRDENLELQSKLRRMMLDVENGKKRSDALAADKQHLMQAMHGLLRQSMEQSKAAAAEKKERAKAAKNVSSSAQAAHRHLGKTGAASRVRGHRRSARRAPSMEEDPTSYMAEVGAISGYIARAEALQATAGVAEIPSSQNLLGRPQGDQDSNERQGTSSATSAISAASEEAWSPLDDINPKARQPQHAPPKKQAAMPAEDEDEDGGVRRLLKQAEEELASGTGAD